MNFVMLLLVAITFLGLSDVTNAFTCTSQGVFANTDRNDCKTFVYCDYNMVPEVFYCGINSYYWPEKNGCYSQYDCATNSMPNDSDPCDGTYYYGDIPDSSTPDCSKYIQCRTKNIYNSNGDSASVWQVDTEQCPSGTSYRPGSKCDSDYQCVENFQCTAGGVYQNVNDISTFFMCWPYYTGSQTLFYPEKVNCPGTSKFNPNSMKCDEFYNSNGGASDSDPCSNYNPVSPFVPDPNSVDATSYIACQYDFSFNGNNYIGTKDATWRKQCPGLSRFSPLLGKCYDNYDPNETCVKDPCSTGPGDYVDYELGNCKRFIHCRDTSNVRDVYKPIYEFYYCPPGTRYSPDDSECSQQYTCPTFPVNYCYPQTTTTAPATTATTVAATTAGPTTTTPNTPW